jgi:hypothetical protein
MPRKKKRSGRTAHRDPSHLPEQQAKFLISSEASQLSLKNAASLSLLARKRDVTALANEIASITNLKDRIMDIVCRKLGNVPKTMGNRKHGFVSVLMRKSLSNMAALNLSNVVDEMREKFPELYAMLLAVMLPENRRYDDEPMCTIRPRLAMIYAVALQARNCELSLLQRVVGALLADHVSDQKVSNITIE